MLRFFSEQLYIGPVTEADLEPSRDYTSKHFCEKRSILDIRLGSKYATASYFNIYFDVKFQLIKYRRKRIYVQIE